MKNLFILLFSIFALNIASAQQTNAVKPADNPEARAATDKLVAKYDLTADQAKMVYKAQVRKAKNMAEIAPLMNTDLTTYYKKLAALQQGSLNSIRKVLRTQAQIDIFNKTAVEVRKAKNVKRKELMVQGKKEEEIQQLLLDVYQE